MKDLGIPKLTEEQMEELCKVAEEAARKYVLSKLPSKGIKMLSVGAEAEGKKPLTLTVDVDITLTKRMRDFNARNLVCEAVKEAFSAADKYLRGLKCRLKK